MKRTILLAVIVLVACAPESTPAPTETPRRVRITLELPTTEQTFTPIPSTITPTAISIRRPTATPQPTATPAPTRTSRPLVSTSTPVPLLPTNTQPPVLPTDTPLPPQQNCDPSYPDFCIPPPPPDLDCKDVRPHRNFIVLPPDPHDFDRDGNGRGCES
jgi:hypothetical protein